MIDYNAIDKMLFEEFPDVSHNMLIRIRNIIIRNQAFIKCQSEKYGDDEIFKKLLASTPFDIFANYRNAGTKSKDLFRRMKRKFLSDLEKEDSITMLVKKFPDLEEKWIKVGARSLMYSDKNLAEYIYDFEKFTNYLKNLKYEYFMKHTLGGGKSTLTIYHICELLRLEEDNVQKSI